MKKLSHIIKEEKAFYFPFVLMITMIVLSAMTTTVLIYRNELAMTQHVINQTEAETIIQMSRKKFIQSEVYKEQSSGEIIYVFPSGSATLQYDKIDENTFLGHLTIETNEQFLLETVTHLMIKSD